MIKPIPNHEGYFADTNGNIYSDKGKNGSWRKLKLAPRSKSKKHKHLRVMLSPDRKSYSVHRIIYETFNGPIPSDKLVCHRNDNEYDNRLENLYVGTVKENTADAIKNNKKVMGEECSFAKLTESQVIEIRSLSPDKSYTELALMFSVKKSTISDIVKKRTWKHIKEAN